jgi:hypothetical protein
MEQVSSEPMTTHFPKFEVPQHLDERAAAAYAMGYLARTVQLTLQHCPWPEAHGDGDAWRDGWRTRDLEETT